MAKKSKKSVSPGRLGREDTREAYCRVEPEVLAMQVDEVGRVTAAISYATSIVLGAMPNLESLRDDMKTELKNPPLEELDKLRDYALAALYADLMNVPEYTAEDVQKLIEVARPLRELLLSSAEVLAKFGLFDQATVAEIRSGTGQLDTAKDLVALAALYDANWKTIANQCAVTEEQVQQAASLGVELLSALGERTVGDAKEVELSWAEKRARAFRLLVNKYDRLERAVTYLRWDHGDAGLYIPSLHRRGVALPSSTKDPSTEEGGDSGASTTEAGA